MKTPEFSRVFAAGLRARTRWINLEKQEKTTARKLKRNKSKLGTLDPSHPEDQASESLSATHSAADATQQATPSAICQSAAPAQKPVPPIKIESDMRQTRPLSPLVAGPVPQACVPKTLSDPERTKIFDVFSSSGLTPPNGFEKKTLSELALILAQEKNQAALRAEQKEKEEAALREKQRAIRKAEQTERIARVHRWAERDEGTATVDNRHRAALYKAMFG
ncbi:MAG: hypothetical protein M4579_001147 [Chaenotheca gracillima]|nr:MAG: hypothetical protein M4579_001147 [Chaenotheca gracillima]